MDWFSLTPIKNTTPLAFFDVDSANAWLRQAPRGQATQSAQSAIPIDLCSEQLERMQGTLLDGFVRATLLETLRPEALLGLAQQRSRFSYVPRPLSPAAFAAFAGSQRLGTALTTGYLQCAEEFAATKADANWTATAAQRALQSLRLAIEDHFIAGIQVPPPLWQRALRVIEMSTALGIQGHLISDPCFPEQGNSSCLQHYALLALMGLADPYGLLPVEYNVLQRLLLRWRELPVFSTLRDEESKHRWVNLRLLETTPRHAIKNALWLEVGAIRSKLKKRLEALRAGETPDSLQLGRELPNAACQRLLERMRLQLRVAYDPALASANRQSSGESIFVAASIEEGFNLITGFRYNTNTKASASTDRMLHERMALFGQNSIIQDRSTERPKFGEAWILDAQTEEEIICSNPSNALQHPLQLGQFLALRKGEQLTLSKLTRAQVLQNGKFEASMRIYPGKPLAVEGHVFDKTGPLHFPLLLLPADIKTQSPALAFIPEGIGAKVHQPIDTNVLSPKKIRLTALIDRGSNFDVYRFDPIN